jgi:hypothetical protein
MYILEKRSEIYRLRELSEVWTQKIFRNLFKGLISHGPFI